MATIDKQLSSNAIFEYDEMEGIDNSHISYTDRKLYIRLNDRNEWRNRLEISERNLMKAYPSLFSGNTVYEPLEHIINKVFTEGLSMKCYFTNLSFKNNRDSDVRILAIRPAKDGVYLNEVLPNGITLRFKGHVLRGVFIVDEIQTTTDSGYRDFEIEVDLTPFHTNIPEGWKDNFLNEILDEAKSLTEHTEKKLEEWGEYLKWRKEIARRQIAGCKYYKVTYDHKFHFLVFWLVCEGEEEFNKFKRNLRKDNLQVFNNSYSQDIWHFKLKDDRDDTRANREKSIPLGRYKRVVEKYYLVDFNNDNNRLDYSNENYDSYDEYLLDNEADESTGNTDQDILQQFNKPYVVKVAFDLNKEVADEILEKNYDEEEIEDFIREEVLNNYFEDGFIALSAVGDFALINRFERAIEQLKRDENFSPNLALWLFDVTTAKKPTQMEEVDQWLNKGIEKNEDQKRAVIKMLSAPDLCLIQGPPGTGKTTVIAEAIYQFVRRGNRVLIASQSNDAVDNALERLADSSAIRAIRLGQKNRRKRNKGENSINKFAEDNAMPYFYSSLSKQISTQWLNRWKKIDSLKLQLERDARDIRLLAGDIEDIQKSICSVNNHIQVLAKENNSLQLTLKQIQEHNQNINNEKQQAEAFGEFLKSGIELSFKLSLAQLEVVFLSLNPILLGFQKYGIVLNPIVLSVTEPSGVGILNNGLVATINGFRYFIELSKKIRNCEQGNNSGSAEIAILERKKAQLTSLMDEMDENGTDDEAYEDVHSERRKLIKKINDLKKDSNIIVLSSVEKQLLSKELIGEIEENGSIRIDLLACIFNKLEPEIREFYSFVNGVKNVLEAQGQKYNLKSSSDITKSLETNNAKIHNFKDHLEELKSTLVSKQRELIIINQKYNIEAEISNGSLEKLSAKIQELYQDNNTTITKQFSIRQHWEELLQGFVQRLDDKNTIKYDKEYYQPIYINACNVVGISCTDNMRALTDKGYKEFDVVIIDEVSKATPPELLIPLMKGKKAILVGDHRQLPPMFNEHEKSYKEIINSVDEANEEIRDLMTEDNFRIFKNMVTASLFKSYFENADPLIKHSLLTQYRMHSDIMCVINRFYENHLNSGYNQLEENEKKDHGLTIRGLDGTTFILPSKHAYWIDSSKLPDGTDFYESRPEFSTSTENVLECYIIVELLKKMATEYARKGYCKEKPKMVGVISFYQIQVNRLKNMFKQERKVFDFSSLQIDINTVDRFQGKEKEIIITSLVRNTKSIKRREDSHIAAFERINVAFSRAQEMLVIVGAKDMYFNQPVKLPNMDSVGETTVYVYKNIIEDLHRKACFFDSSKIISTNNIQEISNAMQEYGGKL